MHSPIQATKMHFNKDAIDGDTKSCGNGSAQQQSGADNAADKTNRQKQRVRAYGLVRACGSLGYILTSASAALGTRLLAPNALITQTFVVSIAISNAIWFITSASFFFFRIEHIRASPNLLRDICKFMRVRCIYKIFAILFVEGILYGSGTQTMGLVSFVTL